MQGQLILRFMLSTVPLSLCLFFGFTTALAVGLLYYAAGRSGRVLGVVLVALTVQGGLALSGFYADKVATSLPPRLALALGPPLLLLLTSVATTWGRAFLAGLRLDILTLVHVVRLPVEVTLYLLFTHGVVPRIMTFEGRNWDIIMGLSAPLLYYLLRRRVVGSRTLLAWNILGICLLANIVITAVLSVPTPLQRFGFEQPNVAILYLPFIWLPAVVVPIVLLSHMAALRQLLAQNRAAGLVAS